MSGQGLTSEGVAVIRVSDINNYAPQFSPSSVSPDCISRLLTTIVTGFFIHFVRLVIAVQFPSCGKQEEL